MVATKETAAERTKRIRDQYHATTEFNSHPYRVEVESCLINRCWITQRWYFPTEQDAIAYCEQETKNDTARVIKEKFDVETNTIYSTPIYMKGEKA